MLTLDVIGGKGSKGMLTEPRYLVQYNNGDWTVGVRRLATEDPYAVILECLELAMTRDERHAARWRETD